MPASLNRATIIGNLGAEPETRHTQAGKPVVRLRVATSESWKSKNGEKQEKTEWHSVIIFSEGLAGVAEKYLSKGDRVLIEGFLQTRAWKDQAGKEHKRTEIVLQGPSAKLLMLGGDKPKADPQAPLRDRDDPRTMPRGSGSFADEPDDRIPF